MIKRISFYDFDGTLMDSPLPDSGKQEWKLKTGEEYPHVGWWGRPESLNNEILSIKPFKTIVGQLLLDNSRSDTYTVILTSRMEKLKPQIEKILRDNNILYDELSLKEGNDGDKDDRVKVFLKKFPHVEEINIYDDRQKEIDVFRRLINDIGNQYHINLYRVDNGKFGLIESLDAITLINQILLEELEKIKKPKI